MTSVTSPTTASAPNASTTARECSRTSARGGGLSRRARSASSTWVPTSPAPPVTRTVTRERRVERRTAARPRGLRARRRAPSRQLGLRGARWQGRSSGRAPTHRHPAARRSEEHTSELQSRLHLVCRLLLEKKKKKKKQNHRIMTQSKNNRIIHMSPPQRH